MRMMQRTVRLALAALLISGAASADENGGKILWIRDAQFGLAKAKLEGRPAMLFFGAEFCRFCRQLGASALSDEKVVAATQRLIPVYVDCTKKGEQTELLARYKVQGFPTILYVDPDGNLLREMETRDASAIVKDIDVVVAKVSPRATIWQPSVALAKDSGKKSKKPLALYLIDPKADVLRLNVKLTKDLGDRKAKFVWVLESGQAAMLKKYEVEAPSTVVVVDPRTDEILSRIPVKDDDKTEALNKALDEAAKLMKK
jgi:thiol-disulfide isomerase/thioredoxin